MIGQPGAWKLKLIDLFDCGFGEFGEFGKDCHPCKRTGHYRVVRV